MAIILALIGLLAGILSGLALGGGTLLVPSLVILMELTQHQAQAIALAAFLPISTVAIVTHYKNGNVKPRLALLLASGAIAGALVGATLAAHIPAPLLRKIFGLFLVFMGSYEVYNHRKAISKRKVQKERKKE
ncbi:sulfite exporter TauE/SafE family protein [Heliorestis acidaminivorans]|uniref:Probable membrane transporter protein n=1 Tax=Heliorestis acidaminivorans TaxID=553427 RepID=A0A6I0F0H5_9FIRM|nr:sulfite exporter TauE/SafE family protein [Heliorestis acidaminivorans]KAB2952574.1 sulfite exporter TauE/SafE family protein [Heliorestis acidaminivorans]